MILESTIQRPLSFNNGRCPYSLANWSEDQQQDQEALSIEQFELFGLEENSNESKNIKFEVNNSLNRKITLCHCRDWSTLFRLQVDALVHPTNEQFDRWANPRLTNSLYNHCGPQLRKCLYNKIKYCPVGNCKITRGYLIQPEYIIHTASPHYKFKFHTASEQALFQCYFHCLETARHYNFRTIAIPNLALVKHNYPMTDAIHLAVRVIRCFMEQFPDAFDLIVLCIDDISDVHQYDLYWKMMKLYFPRNHQEQILQKRFSLPQMGPLGEPIRPERAIRIQENPIKNLIHSGPDSGLEDSNDDYDYCSYSSSYSECCESPLATHPSSTYFNVDECRRRLMQLNFNEEFPDDSDHQDEGGHLGSTPKSRSSSFVHLIASTGGGNAEHNQSNNSTSSSGGLSPRKDHEQINADQWMFDEHRRTLKAERLFRKCRRMESTIQNYEQFRDKLKKCCYVVPGSLNSSKTNVLVIIGHELVQLLYGEQFHRNFDYILGHLLKQLDKCSSIDGAEYVVLYFHTMVDDERNQSDEMPMTRTELLSRFCDYLSYRHRKSMKQFYIVHPSIMNRLYVWWLKTFYCKFLKDKVTFVSNVQCLKSIVGQQVLNGLPKFIGQHRQQTKKT